MQCTIAHSEPESMPLVQISAFFLEALENPYNQNSIMCSVELPQKVLNVLTSAFAWSSEVFVLYY